MNDFTGRPKEDTVDIGVGSVPGDDRSGQAIVETKTFTLRYDRDKEDIDLINSHSN